MATLVRKLGPAAQLAAVRQPTQGLEAATVHHPDNTNETASTAIQGWRWLFNSGAAAALILFALFLVGAIGMISAAANVSAPNTWLAPLFDNWLVTLFKINLPASGERSASLGVFNQLDLGIMVLFVTFSLSLYPALKQLSRVWSLVAVSLPFLGILLFITTGTAGRSALLVSALITSTLMFRSHAFGRTIAYTGIAASVVLFLGGDIVTAIFHSSSSVAVLLAIGYVLWEAWLLLVALSLFRIGREQRIRG